MNVLLTVCLNEKCNFKQIKIVIFLLVPFCWSDYRIPVHYCVLEVVSFEEQGISIHMKSSGLYFII